MVRVLHFTDPEDAGRRLNDLGISPRDAAILLRELRACLLLVSGLGVAESPLPRILEANRIPFAEGERGICFSVSSESQVAEWARESPYVEDFLSSVREAIRRYTTRGFTLSCRDRSLSLSGGPKLMGVLNVTPDSFSDGGRFTGREDAVRRGLEMVEEGAEVIDIGGESTRPGSRGVSAEVELGRVIPVIAELAGRTGAILSVDTTKASVAREAAAAGVHMINDISALSDDPEMAEVVRSTGCAVVLMHRRGIPETMQHAPSYRSLIDELLEELEDRVDAARKAGILRGRILVDPGIGFGKRLEDNLDLHRHLPELRNLGMPILFGSSRKSFLGSLTGKETGERVFGTAASVALAAAAGAHMIRVHDVREMRDVVRVAGAIAGAGR